MPSHPAPQPTPPVGPSRRPAPVVSLYFPTYRPVQSYEAYRRAAWHHALRWVNAFLRAYPNFRDARQAYGVAAVALEAELQRDLHDYEVTLLMGSMKAAWDAAATAGTLPVEAPALATYRLAMAGDFAGEVC
jgi:hypothetical protein